jgi:predicted ATPase
VNVSSWIPDPDNTGEYLDGAGHWFKVIGMKARNPITRNILLDSLTLSRYGFTLNNCGTLSYPGLSTQTDMLNKYADLFATEEGEFYGKRHAMYDAELAGLTEDFLRWGMLDIIQYDGTNYFLQNVNADTDEDQGAFTMVEIEGHDYNLGNVIIGQARDTYIVP